MLNGEFIYVAQYFDGDPHGDLILVGGSGTGVVEMISLRQKKVCANKLELFTRIKIKTDCFY